VRATDRQRLEHSVDDLQYLASRARSRLFFSVITMLSLVVLFADITLPDAAVLGIYCAEDGKDVGPDEALRPTSTPPLRAPDAGTPPLGDCRSARVARTLITVRDRAPPAEGANGRITIPAPLSDPPRLDAPTRVGSHPSSRSFLSPSRCTTSEARRQDCNDTRGSGLVTGLPGQSHDGMAASLQRSSRQAQAWRLAPLGPVRRLPDLSRRFTHWCRLSLFAWAAPQERRARRVA
jgi:hypothetical protein